MSAFPGSPRLLKGAIVAMPAAGLPGVIVFQYNPDTLTRSLQARTSGREGAPGEALRFTGPPEETIDGSIEIDATDQLELANPVAVLSGIHPQLAQLELLLYPHSGLAVANEVLANLGVIELVPAEAPLTLFVWGPARVVPVRITSLSIEEEAFDPLLNPIRAKVGLSLRVLSYQDLGLASVGGALFMVHQVAKEVMASLGGVAGAVGGAASLSAGGSVNVGF